MKRILALWLSVCILLVPFRAHSEGPAPAASAAVQDIPPGPDKITAVRKGDAAPYDGQVFDNATALRWGNWLLQYRLRLQSDVELQKKLGDTESALWQKKYDLLAEKYESVTKDYQKQVAAAQQEALAYKAEAESPPWYKSPLFGFTAGVIFTGIAVGLGAVAMHATK